jgi:hypothetical protein
MKDLQKYDKVKIVTNKYHQIGVNFGAIGCVIEDYRDGKYEIDLVDIFDVPPFVVDENEIEKLDF